MTDHERRLADLEKRVARLERAAERPDLDFYDAFEDFEKRRAAGERPMTARGWQFCPCGRDVCRAPDCPSHRNDPLGR